VKLLAYIQANPGQRMEVIGAALGLPRHELALPIKKLLAEKKITRKGVKRATEYFASSSSTSNGGLVLVKKRKKVVETTGAAGSASAASAP
jgi:predicted transcriptional regulator